LTKLQEALAARRALSAQQNPELPDATPPEIDYSQYAASIPEVEPVDEAWAEANKTIDELIDRLGIVGAYKEFIHKMTPKVGRKTESIMISCPYPWHADKNPSAWMNSEKNTWHCGGCQRGGDIYDLAAIGLGFDVDNYKTTQFVELRRAIATHFGYEVFAAPGADDIIYQPEPESEPVKTNGHTVERTIASAIISTDAEYEEELEKKLEAQLASSEVYTLKWREILKPNTFLYKYLEATSKDYNVEEFHFWNAMLALGMAAGRNVYADDNPRVYGNLFVCLMGGSGTGKSKSRYYLDRIVDKVLPFKIDMDYPDGVKEIPTPNSAEYLIKAFSHPIQGVTGAGTMVVTGYAPIRGIIRFEELSSFKNIAGRSGSDLGSRMLEFYDCKHRVTTGSRATGDTIAELPFASAFTTTQPKSLSRILSQADEDSGFLNRWLFVGGHPKPGKFWGNVSIDLSAAEKELFRIHVWANDEKAVSLSREAEWQANRDLNDFITKDKDEYDPALGRIDLTIKKICLLFAINEMSTEITLDIYNRAMKLYEYIKAYAIFRQEYLEAESQQSLAEREIVTKIKQFNKRTGDWPTAREIVRSGLPRSVRGTQELSKMLESLTKVNILRAVTLAQKTPGRPSVRYAIETEA